MNRFKKILASAVFLLPMFTFAQGGNDPVAGIDIIIQEASISAKIEINDSQLQSVNALKDEARSHYIAKILPPMINKVMRGKYNEKEVQSVLLKQLLFNRCNPCKAFETFSYKAMDSRTNQSYSIQFNLQTKVKNVEAEVN
tara:strand:- start:4572 stop:4994 length:423 start_codon:yes stop_codon:yes gene_type:complete